MKRNFVSTLIERLKELNPLIQVVLGPRQVGKTMGVKQALKVIKDPHLYVTADDTLDHTRNFILEPWQQAERDRCILVIDEVQKITNWSEIIKKLWDSREEKKRIKCILLGSSSLNLQMGLTESLTGRFELINVPHWSYAESKKGFRINLNDYLAYGGYPATYGFIHDYPRWRDYVYHSIIETVIGKDILQQRPVVKPALFRQLFEILTAYPAQEISYHKLLGQLQDKGNTDLVKHYISLYEGAFLFKTLQKYSRNSLVTKSSSPKILPLCPALCALSHGIRLFSDPAARGRIFEMVVGAELAGLPGKLTYWREGDFEVDYVYEEGKEIYAIEVKSGKKKSSKSLDMFLKKYPDMRTLIITEEMFEKFSGRMEELFPNITSKIP